MQQAINTEKYPAIAKAMHRGETVEVHREDAIFIKDWFRKHGLVVKIHNEFRKYPFRKIELLFDLKA